MEAVRERNYRTAGLSDATHRLGLSKQYICRILQRNGEHSFSQLVVEERLKKVKEYLVETELDLESIAELTGFSSASYLSRVFKKEEGMNASEYRVQKGKVKRKE